MRYLIVIAILSLTGCAHHSTPTPGGGDACQPLKQHPECLRQAPGQAAP